MMLALLEDEEEDDSESEDEDEDSDVDSDVDTEERRKGWIEVMKKHRVQASRLELLASGVGTGHGKVDRSGSIPNTAVS